MNNGFLILALGVIITIIGAVALSGSGMWAACGAGVAVALVGVYRIAKGGSKSTGTDVQPRR